MDTWIEPSALVPGDTIAIVSPAGAVSADFVSGAATMLAGKGYNVRVMPHALGRCGSYSGTVRERYRDFADAWLDGDVKCVLCSRGGYGAVQLVDDLNRLPLAEHAKWLIGFSDISALHALLVAHRIHSIHGPMARYLSRAGENLDATVAILSGERQALTWHSTCGNVPGLMRGRLVGGNMAVLSALIGTGYDIYRHGDILVLEDVGEPIYKVERMLWQLKLAGVLDRMQGVIVGDFCDWKPDSNHDSMQQMIRHMLVPCGKPIAFDAPIGHAGRCMPWIEAALVEVNVTPGTASARYVFEH